MAAIKRKVTLAAYALLGLVPRSHSAEPESEPGSWKIDTSFLSYSESNRISILEPTIGMSKDFQDNRSLDLSFTVDTISGVTPIGTLPPRKSTATVNSLSAASGGSSGGGSGIGGSGGGGSGGVTLDVPTAFMADVRYAFNSSWRQPIGLGMTGKLSGDVSLERDFQSVGGSLVVSRDFNRKNTTVSLGVSPESDKVVPHGGIPVPFADPTTAGSLTGAKGTKKNIGLLVGITQIISPRALMQWNYSQSRETGDLADPYKLLSQIDGVTGDPLNSVYEKRPALRNDRSYYWLTRYHLTDDVVSVAYRYYTDDWGIRSHTVDLNYHWSFSEDAFLEPRFRFYHQSAADFYRIGLISGDPLPNFASGDYRLAEFDAYTFGLRYGYNFGSTSLLVLRFDYYTQVGNGHPADAIGIQKGFDLFPALQAIIVQAQLSFDPAHVADDFATFFQE